MTPTPFLSDPDSLVRDYRWLAEAIAADFFFPGADRDDVKQEAMVALLEAARSYDPSRGPFKVLARIVVKRRLRDALKAARARKHELLSAASPLDGTQRAPADVVDLVALRLEVQRIVRASHALSPLEREALGMSLRGEPYYRDKRLDNAAQRARKRLAA
ncbi:MAG: sigma-70 family RNA polymerase sigma factor [Solirubrobacterales bacterium]|nr:sigma-70 family RNA polymerase sigma factor [Solirubrobacterales bacterium]